MELFRRNDIVLNLLAELLTKIATLLRRDGRIQGDVRSVNIGQLSRIKAISVCQNVRKLFLR